MFTCEACGERFNIEERGFNYCVECEADRYYAFALETDSDFEIELFNGE